MVAQTLKYRIESLLTLAVMTSLFTLADLHCLNAVNGGWSNWGDWSECSQTCEGGVRWRSRTCTNPPPSCGGTDCPGPSKEREECESKPCAVDGSWSIWGMWSECSQTCDGGVRKRNRTCTNPSPSNGGTDCPGPSREREGCNEKICAVAGGWSVWGAWGECTQTFGGGVRLRSRTCTNPPPSNGGTDCPGPRLDRENCNTNSCNDGGWTVWGNWGECSSTCGGGVRMRRRYCTNPPPSDGGADCPGPRLERDSCNDTPCSSLSANPGISCKVLKQQSPQLPSAIYWVNLNGSAVEVYCDMVNEGGGWTLVWSYTFTRYSDFSSPGNAVTPFPTWPASSIGVPRSKTIPLSETQYNAMEFSLWKDIGNELLIKSNINNWISCKPGPDGSLVTFVDGDISCKIVKRISPICNSAPNALKATEAYGPSLISSTKNKQYYYFEGNTASNVEKYPAHDPCGTSNQNHRHKVNNPHGNIFIR